jgi:hypothetical protein
MPNLRLPLASSFGVFCFFILKNPLSDFLEVTAIHFDGRILYFSIKDF